MTKDESPLPADALLVVTCTKCDTRNPQGERQCAKCRCWLPGNAGRTPEVPGVSRAQRGGPESLSERWGNLFEQFVDGAVADLGGTDACSQIEIALIELAGQQYVIAAMLQEYINSASALTPRGRVRTAVTALNATVDRFDKLAAKLGLQRRDGWQKAHRELDAERRAERGEDIPDDDRDEIEIEDEDLDDQDEGEDEGDDE